MSPETIDREFLILKYSPTCTFCKNAGSESRRCLAVGDKPIALSIWNHVNKHRAPVKGDNGIQFEPIEEPRRREYPAPCPKRI